MEKRSIITYLIAIWITMLLAVSALPVQAKTSKGIPDSFVKHKAKQVAEVRKLREMCINEYKIRAALIERANTSRIVPVTRRITSLRTKEWEYKKAIPVNTASAAYKSAYYRWKSTAAQLKDAQNKERKLANYYNAKFDQATIFYKWGGKLDQTARWLVNKASAKQILKYDYRKARKQVQALFKKYPPSTRR